MSTDQKALEAILLTTDGQGKEAKREALAKLLREPEGEVVEGWVAMPKEWGKDCWARFSEGVQVKGSVRATLTIRGEDTA